MREVWPGEERSEASDGVVPEMQGVQAVRDHADRSKWMNIGEEEERFMSRKKAVQQNLIEVPDDELGKAARKYLKVLEAIGEAKELLGSAAGDLVSLMRAKRRLSIRVEGQIILCKHVEAQDQIKVKKVKNPVQK